MDYIGTVLGRLLLSTLLALAIKGAVTWSGHTIAWIWAIVVSLLLVFGGWLILDGDLID